MPEPTPNQATLESYESHTADYVAGTPPVMTTDVSGWAGRMLDGLDATARILEIGSAFGREADYVETLGYSVQRSDATRDFVRLLREQGHHAQVLNALTDPLGGPWDLVFANCVFLHFTPEEFKDVLARIAASLAPGGRLGFSVKRGQGSEWSTQKIGAPRFFQYWSQSELAQLVAGAGLELLDIRDGLTQGDADKIYVVAQRHA